MPVYFPTPNFVFPRNRKLTFAGHSYGSYACSAESAFGSAGVSGWSNGCSTYTRCVMTQALIKTMQPLEWIANYCVNSATSSQILSQIPQVLASGAGYVWLQAITNDAYNAIPAATTIANLTQLLAAFTNNGICVLVGTDYPRNASTDFIANNHAIVYDWLKDYAKSNPYIIVGDCYPYFTDLTSYANSYSEAPNTALFLNEAGNYIHPNAQGSILAAQPWIDIFNRILPKTPDYVDINGDGTTHGDTNNFIANGALLQGTGGTFGTGASGTAAQGAFTSRTTGAAVTAVCSIVTRSSLAATFAGLYDDGANGYVQKINCQSAAAANELINMSFGRNTATTFTQGDGPYVIEAEVAALANSGVINQLYLQLHQNGSPFGNFNVNVNADAGDYLNQTKYYGKIRSRRFYMQTEAANNLRLFLYVGTGIGANVDFYISNISLKKVAA